MERVEYKYYISIERERNPNAACWRVYVPRGLRLAFPTTMQLTLGNDLCDRISTRNHWYSVSVSACNYHQINIFNSYRRKPSTEIFDSLIDTFNIKKRKEFRVSTGEDYYGGGKQRRRDGKVSAKGFQLNA